jgi:hypothetical protein
MPKPEWECKEENTFRRAICDERQEKSNSSRNNFARITARLFLPYAEALKPLAHQGFFR